MHAEWAPVAAPAHVLGQPLGAVLRVAPRGGRVGGPRGGQRAHELDGLVRVHLRELGRQHDARVFDACNAIRSGRVCVLVMR